MRMLTTEIGKEVVARCKLRTKVYIYHWGSIARCGVLNGCLRLCSLDCEVGRADRGVDECQLAVTCGSNIESPGGTVLYVEGKRARDCRQHGQDGS